MTLPMRRCGQWHSGISCIACYLTDEVDRLQKENAVLRAQLSTR